MFTVKWHMIHQHCLTVFFLGLSESGNRITNFPMARCTWIGSRDGMRFRDYYTWRINFVATTKILKRYTTITSFYSKIIKIIINILLI